MGVNIKDVNAERSCSKCSEAAVQAKTQVFTSFPKLKGQVENLDWDPISDFFSQRQIY